ncbi:MAG: protein kinase domain-containing protein, partial [Sphaerospermopsis kisseleviana]
LQPNQDKKLNRQEFRKIKELFAKEAQHLEKLNHPQIPKLKEYIIINKKLSLIAKQEFYIVEEYIEGHELRQELIPSKRLSNDEVWEILYNIVNVLAFVHLQGLIHRDIKPENIIRRKKDGKLFLIDFGSVKDMTEAKRIKSLVVMTSEPYTPMEQKSGFPTFTTDIYAVGMIGIEALTGIHPDVRRQQYITIDDKTDKFIWRNFADEKLSQELADVIDIMVHPQWAKRYNTGTQALEALQKIAPPHPVQRIPRHENLNVNPITTEKPGLLLVSQQMLGSVVNTVLTLPEVITITPDPESSNTQIINEELLSRKVVIIAGMSTALAFGFLSFNIVRSWKAGQEKPQPQEKTIKDTKDKKINQLHSDQEKPQPQETIITEPKDENLTQTYVDKQKYIGFSIKHSDKWTATTAQPDEEEKVKLSRKYQNTQNNCPLEVSVYIADLGKALSLAEYKNIALNRITQDTTNSVSALNAGTKLNKNNAYQIIFTRQEDGCKLKVLERGTMSFKKAYYIIYKAPEKDYDKFWPVVEKMIDSFEIKEGS